MKHLGCIVIRTEGKAVEESATEIISRIEDLEESLSDSEDA